MKKNKIIIIVFLLLLSFIYIVNKTVFHSPKAKDLFIIDSCLDNGGCWDYIRKQCEFANQGKCIENAKTCTEKWQGMWDFNKQYCIIK